MLFLYGTTVFGFERGAFLAKWFIGVTGSHVRVAINSEGYIKGYTVARPMLVKSKGYKIGPLFADSEAIAEKFLKAVLEELLRQGEPVPAVSIEAPTKKAADLCERLQGKRSFELVYMTTNDLPEACFDINDSEVGGNTKVGNSVKQAPSPGGFSEILGTVPESILLVTVSIHTSARVTVAVCT